MSGRSVLVVATVVLVCMAALATLWMRTRGSRPLKERLPVEMVSPPAPPPAAARP